MKAWLAPVPNKPLITNARFFHGLCYLISCNDLNTLSLLRGTLHIELSCYLMRSVYVPTSRVSVHPSILGWGVVLWVSSLGFRGVIPFP